MKVLIVSDIQAKLLLQAVLAAEPDCKKEGFALETLPEDRPEEFNEDATRGRSATHHLKVKSALSFLYCVPAG